MPVEIPQTDLNPILVDNIDPFSESQCDTVKTAPFLMNPTQTEVSPVDQRNQLLQSRMEQQQVIELELRDSREKLRQISGQLLDAQEAERKRIAMDLHDGIGQSLTAMKFALEQQIHTCRDKLPAENLLECQAIVRKLQHTVEEVRRISMALRPSILDDLGISPTIRWFCREFQRTYDNIQTRTDLNIEDALVDQRLAIVIYRIFQEVFNNVAKHAKATEIHTRLYFRNDRENDSLVLEIKDNGIGFDREQVLQSKPSIRGGLGLASLIERAELSGGQLRIVAVPGLGTTIHASWPKEVYASRH